MVLISVQHSFSSFSHHSRMNSNATSPVLTFHLIVFLFFFLTFPHALPLEANPEIITTVTDPMPGSAR